MAKDYYVNNTAQDNGDHEVHEQGCYWLGRARDTSYLGMFASCREAMVPARVLHRQSNGCAHCSPACHTS